jgi:hypothetical protein
MLNHRLLCSIFILNFFILSVNAGVGFLRDQRKCKLRCENGGVCAYVIGHPEIHRCICMKDMYYGEKCEFSVTIPPPTQRILITTTQEVAHVEIQRPIKIVPHSIEQEPEHTGVSEEPKQVPHTVDVEEDDEGEEESVEKLQESHSTETSYVTLEQAEQKAIEPEKATDDYFEPSEAPVSSEAQPNIDVSNGYFEPDTKMHQYQSSKTTHSVEPDNVIEEESGWMMVKKKSTNFALRSSSFDLYKNFAFITAGLFLGQYFFN